MERISGVGMLTDGLRKEFEREREKTVILSEERMYHR
jgi:hypothetical protein